MSSTTPTISVSPRVGALLTEVAETPDLETALWRVLSDYIELKVSSLTERSAAFEKKWDMPFGQFSDRFKAGNLDRDSYDYEVESEYWEWERVETLLDHYTTLQSRWT